MMKMFLPYQTLLAVGRCTIGFGCLLLSAPAVAQIAPDATLGAESSQVTGNFNQRIEGGAVRGNHLFHSFDEFNVNDDQSVYFSSPGAILTIFSRITGNNPSVIDGTLGVEGSADLFLLNPNGIMFGPNGRLDIEGSFIASTAESLTFGDGLGFSAVNPEEPPLLNVSLVPGLQYGSQPREITTETNTNLQVGENLMLGAHRLTLKGTIEAGRDIILQGKDGQLSDAQYTVGGYLFTQDSNGSITGFISPHNQSIISLGDVQLNGDYTGESLYILSGGQIDDGPGTHSINVDSGSSDLVIHSLTHGVGQGQAITLKANGQPIVDIRSNIDWAQWERLPEPQNNISIIETTQDSTTNAGVELYEINNSGNPIYVVANSGDITIREVSSNSSGVRTTSPNSLTGENGGNIDLVATGNIDVRYVDSYTQVENDAVTHAIYGGNGGAVNITAGRDIRVGRILSNSYTFSEYREVYGGTGGDIGLLAGGNIIYAGSISADSDAQTNYGATVTGAQGGNIYFIAEGDIQFIKDNNFFDSNPGNIDSSSSALAFESDGDITGGSSGSIVFSAGESINVDTLFSYVYLYSLEGDVDKGSAGGNVTFLAENTIDVDKIISSSYSSVFGNGSTNSGNGGHIRLEAGENINVAALNSSSRSLSNSREQSFAGNSIDQATAAHGGDINLIAGEDINLLPGKATLNPESLNSSSFAQIPVGEATSGDGGNITLQAQRIRSQSQLEQNRLINSISLALEDSSQVGQTGTGGDTTLIAENSIGDLDILTLSTSGQSGNVNILSSGDLEIFDLNITASKQLEIVSGSPQAVFQSDFVQATQLKVDGQGQSGNISVIGSGDITFTDSNFLSDTSGTDAAGTVSIFSPGLIIFDDTALNSNTSGPGQAGSIRIESQEGIRLAGAGSQVSAQTSDRGIAGNIDLIAPDVTIENSAEVSTSTNGEGAAGDINLNVDTLSLSNGGEILALTSGTGNSGTIIINATESVELGEGVQNFEPVISVETSDAGKAGNIEINTPSFTLSETARITATATDTATNPDGGGSISLNANQMNLAGIVGIFAETEGQAPGGVLHLQPYHTNPDLDIDLAPGAKISASTSGSGTGGNLRVTAPELIHISGQGELAVATTGSGRAGNIDMAARTIELDDGVKVSATASGTGSGGNINVEADRLTLRNSSEIVTETRNSNGGNIVLNLEDYLLLRHNSLISSTAGTAEAGGNGGNIDINVPNGFIVAVPRENSDITANAFLGNGGNVTVSAQNILGTEFRDVLTPESDITASSRFGNDGTVTLNILNVDPGRGLTELPANLADQSGLIAQRCLADSEGQSAFVVTGRGGVPPTPIEVTQGETSGLADLDSYETEPVSTASTLATSVVQQPNNQLVEAQTWTVNENGNLEFVAQGSGVDVELTHGGNCAGWLRAGEESISQ